MLLARLQRPTACSDHGFGGEPLFGLLRDKPDLCYGVLGLVGGALLSTYGFFGLPNLSATSHDTAMVVVFLWLSFPVFTAGVGFMFGEELRLARTPPPSLPPRRAHYPPPPAPLLKHGSSPLRCAYCHDDVAGQVRHCRGCRTVVHSECLAELTRCPTPGCSRIGWERRRAAAPVGQAV